MEDVSIRGIATRVWKNAPAAWSVLALDARRHGERPFTVYEDERVTYESSFRASATLANWLAAQGIGKGDRVALAMRNLPQWPVIFFAVTRLGAIVVPLNAWWTGGELAHALADSGCSVTFFDAERAQRLTTYLPVLAKLRVVVVARPAAAAAAVALEDIIGRPSRYARLPSVAPLEAHIVADDDATIFYTSGTSGMPKMVWELFGHPERSEFDLSSLESVAFGVAPTPVDLARRVRDELGAMPGTGWGMTETMSTVSSVSGADFLAHPSSCGLPVPVADWKLKDPLTARDLPLGEIGELWIKGPMVASGYWNRPEHTALVFENGWMRSGDLARFDADGFCTIVDRLKDVVIRGGENIYCAEVEAVLGDHPAVAEAALIGVPHQTLGEEPMAIVRHVPGRDVLETELQAWVRGRLAAYKTPVRIRFVQELLPRNAGGNLLKAQLRALCASELDLCVPHAHASSEAGA